MPGAGRRLLQERNRARRVERRERVADGSRDIESVHPAAPVKRRVPGIGINAVGASDRLELSGRSTDSNPPEYDGVFQRSVPRAAPATTVLLPNVASVEFTWFQFP
jgi:hypothetical protein